MKLCKHVEYEPSYDFAGSLMNVTSGVAIPIFGWDRDRELDVPLLQCSHCKETIALEGDAVAVNRDGWMDRKAPPLEDVDDMDWDDLEEGEPHVPEGGYDPSEFYASEATMMMDDDEDVSWY